MIFEGNSDRFDIDNYLRAAKQIDYLLEPPHPGRLEGLWRNIGRDWAYAESLAGLLAYGRTYGGPVSQSPGSPVANVAERIGRAITGVYNKVMNFRALDPRDSRKGLAAGSELDRLVSAGFYDFDTGQLRSDQLESEFRRLWPPGSEREPETMSHTDLVTA